MVVADPDRQDKVDKEMAKTYKELAKGNADRNKRWGSGLDFLWI